MPAGRFYSAPIDPGYGQFGQAIAQATGAGIGAYQQGQARQEEQRRFEEARRLEAERYATQQAQLQAQQEFELNQLGYQDAPVMQAMAPTQANDPRAAPGADEFAPPVMLRDPNATPGVKLFGKERFYDPSKARANMDAAFQFKERQKAESAARTRIQNVIGNALADGKLDLQEIAALSAEGIDPKPLADPETLTDPAKASEKLFKSWERQFDKEQAGRVQIQQLENARQQGALTAGQAIATALRDVGGQAAYLRDLGKSAAEIYTELAPRAAAVGGEGALRGMISQAMMEKEGTSLDVARKMATQTLLGRGIYEGSPEFGQQIEGETARIMDAAKARAAAARKMWEAPPERITNPEFSPAGTRLRPASPVDGAMVVPGTTPVAPAAQPGASPNTAVRPVPAAGGFNIMGNADARLGQLAAADTTLVDEIVSANPTWSDAAIRAEVLRRKGVR